MPSLPKAGAALPRIFLPATTGDDCRERTRSSCIPGPDGRDLRTPRTGNVIPGAQGSTPELEGFCDLASAFAQLDVGLFGLSRQTSDYQREMPARLRLPLPILSDAEARMASACMCLASQLVERPI